MKIPKRTGWLGSGFAAHTGQDITRRPALPHCFDSASSANDGLRADIQKFGQKVVRAVAEGLSHWFQDTDVSSESELRSLTGWAKPNLAGQDAAPRKEAEQVLGIGLALLASQRPVPPLAVLEMIANAYSLEKAEGESDKRPERAVSALIVKSHPRLIASFAKVAILQGALVQAAQAQARQDARLLVDTRNEVGGLESRLASESKRAADLTKAVAELEAKRDELEMQLKRTREIAAFDQNTLKVKYKRILGEEFRRLANDATDSLDLEPPKPDFSKKYLAQLLQKIDEEIAWLNEHSG